MTDKAILSMLSEAMSNDDIVTKEVATGATTEDKLDALIREIKSLRATNDKILKESHVIPKSSTEIHLMIGGKIFRGNMELLDK